MLNSVKEKGEGLALIGFVSMLKSQSSKAYDCFKSKGVII